ncbi:twin-arginine translocase subunit TatC [Ferroacidibacillus organovorans]|uniref:Sec-independent protein translocase protein TatC n=1 Tax=Ferroacidibacillus organovorans TaxID=1765683 RepID=A0A1V4EXU3_9BACL|nr:twin-arginine translocase subunit TatC [Ferroacidibacillus organovorans]OPG17682.1 twin arginine-targeting protein translocase TatC [Ferroacidibacillus organovorans]
MQQRFVPHMEELRKRIIFVLAFFLISLIGSLTFVNPLYHILTKTAGNVPLAVLGPGDIVSIYFMIGGICALVFTTPFLFWQVWLFVSPGLQAKERRYAARLIAPITFMFLLGISFGYFLVFPQVYHFLQRLGQQSFRFFITATEYFSFMTNIVLPFGFFFELPVVVVFLTRIGILTPGVMRKFRRFAYFGCVVLGTLISPPELISHLSVTVPLILLYELSIFLSAATYRKRQRAEAWWREDKPVARNVRRSVTNSAANAELTPQESPASTPTLTPGLSVAVPDSSTPLIDKDAARESGVSGQGANGSEPDSLDAAESVTATFDTIDTHVASVNDGIDHAQIEQEMAVFLVKHLEEGAAFERRPGIKLDVRE